jgi:pimeloyl-ACP methyl ester carboxylesterase
MRRRALLALVSAGAAGIWLWHSEHRLVWPYRNTLQHWLASKLGLLHPPELAARGVLRGMLRAPGGAPIAGGRVLVAASDGTSFFGDSDADGSFEVRGVPPGRYAVAAGAPGRADAFAGGLFGIVVPEDGSAHLDIELAPFEPPVVLPPQELELRGPERFSTDVPVRASAVRWRIRYRAGAREGPTAFCYAPQAEGGVLPALLAVYPGPAEDWQNVSLALAAAGFAVVSTSPLQELDVETDVDELRRLAMLVEAGRLPRAGAGAFALLGGSYSGLHVARLAARHPGIARAIVLLGPPTDLFELRRELEAGRFAPPFGLDRALIALGLPSREPQRYWRWSSRHYAAELGAPLLLVHSLEDEVVPVEQSRLLAEELERLGRPCELHLVEGLGHYLRDTERTPEVEALYELTVEFLRRELR